VRLPLRCIANTKRHSGLKCVPEIGAKLKNQGHQFNAGGQGIGKQGYGDIAASQFLSLDAGAQDGRSRVLIASKPIGCLDSRRSK
jgi:hypothetical protein